MLGVIVALVFALTTVAIAGAFLLVARRSADRRVEERLEEVTSGGDHVSAAGEGASELVKTEAASPLPRLDAAVRQTARGSAIERWLEQSGLRISLSALLAVTVGLAIGGGLLSATMFQRGWAGAVGAALGAVLPIAYLRHKRGARMGKFEEYFPEALELISRAVRAGHAFSAGMKMAADELEDPVGPEFRKTFDEQNFGLPLADALNHLAARVPSLDVRFFVTAVLIQRDTGGNLAEILDNLAHVVRERFKIRRQVRVHTAHGRMTGYVLLVLPAFLGVALMFINPDHINLLFTEQMGQQMIIGAIVMQAIGYLWIKQVVKIEV